MLTFIIRRLLVTIPMLLVISFLVYLGLELTPGDAASSEQSGIYEITAGTDPIEALLFDLA